MNMMKSLMVAALAASSLASMAVPFGDTFTGPLDAGWVEDRWLPANVTTTGGTLNLYLSNGESQANRPAPFDIGFYNYQGIKHDADVTGPWVFSAQQYVAPEVLSGGFGNRAASVWGRSEGAGGEATADYYIAGFTTDGGPTWQVWDSDTSGWNNISTPVTPGVHTWNMILNGSVLDYMLDGNLVYTDSTLDGSGRDASHFTTMFAQGKNFGDATTVPSTTGDLPVQGTATYQFDNFNVGARSSSVPDSSSSLGLLSASIGGLAFAKRRFTRK